MLFRYPGGKSKIKDEILKRLIKIFQTTPGQYREPFFGGGSIGLNMVNVPNVSSVWFNDFDSGIAAIWSTVLNNPEELKDKINSYIPSVDSFFQIKDELKYNKINDIVELAFKKLVIHQTSYSGLGIKSGSPLGGINQKSEYKIDCRWNAKTLNKNIDKIYKSLENVDIVNDGCTSFDFECIIDDFKFEDIIRDDVKPAVLYLDPPYYLKGSELYQHSFSDDDHIRLAEALKNTGHSWILSYDDHFEIRKLYEFANIEEIDLNYTINGSRNKKELLISNEYF